MKKETLKWRLTKLPTSEEVSKLVNDKIISKEEGREILFSTESEEERDEKSLKSEIKFLRDVIEKLSSNQTTRIVEVIKEVQKPYYRYDWYQPYMYYCTSGVSSGLITTNASAGTATYTMAGNAPTSNIGGEGAFSAIKTF